MFLVRVIGNFDEVEETATYGKIEDALLFAKTLVEGGRSVEDVKFFQELDLTFTVNVEVAAK